MLSVGRWALVSLNEKLAPIAIVLRVLERSTFSVVYSVGRAEKQKEKIEAGDK